MNLENYTPTLEEAVMTDINERFRGDRYDMEKLERLNRMRRLCREIAEAERGVSMRPCPLSDRSRNGMVGLDMPRVILMTAPGVLKRLAALFPLADDACVSAAADDGVVRLTFCVRDMWTRWHYDE